MPERADFAHTPTGRACLRLAAAGAVTILLAAGCGRAVRSNLPSLPPRIQGHRLALSLSGKDATRLLAQLHGQFVAPPASRVGVYGAGSGAIVLYVSRFASPRVARNQLAAMARRIGPGSSGFHSRDAFEVDGNTVHSWLGHGQRHYLLARGTDLMWLAAPESIGRAALAEVLAVPVDAVPDRAPA